MNNMESRQINARSKDAAETNRHLSNIKSELKAFHEAINKNTAATTALLSRFDRMEDESPNEAFERTSVKLFGYAGAAEVISAAGQSISWNYLQHETTYSVYVDYLQENETTYSVYEVCCRVAVHFLNFSQHSVTLNLLQS